MISDNIIAQVHRPSRYLGGEVGSVRKDLDKAKVTFALAFPDVYEIGMSHLGFAILYHIINGIEWAAAERVYAPWPDMEEKMHASGDRLSSLESNLPLERFDVLGFTLQYELSYTNILNMLDLAGIPRRRETRGEAFPLIVAGGPCAFNPEPLADFIDAAVIGDGEEAVVELCRAVRDSRKAGEGRPQLLERLAKIEGIYIPSFFAVDYRSDGTLDEVRPLKPGYEKVRRRFLADLETAPYPTKPIVPFMTTVHDRVAMEIARGCTRGCRFCQAGYIYRPVRERSPERILELTEEALRETGYGEVSLLSLSTGDYGCIEPLLIAMMKRLADRRVAVSFPSLRVGSLTPGLMEEIKKVRKTGFTLAPEAGTERLREVINKGITEEDLLESTRAAFSLGWRLIKLYFMVGLPTETAEDVAAIVDLADRVKRTGKGTEGGADVNVAVSTFVPKAHTPFQWERQIGIGETLERQEMLREALKRKKLRLKWHDASTSFLEGVFARGDRRLGTVLEKAVDFGCRFDGWSDHFDFERWEKAFHACGIDPEWYLRERGQEEVLPWDHLDCGVPKEYFLAERQRSFQGCYTPDCRTADCSGCGVCDFEAIRMRLNQRRDLSLPPSPPVAADEEEDRFKIRLQVSKTGRARFVSHLEFMSVIHRAASRAELPVRFSRGFHPAPRISFPDALPTGVESEAEIIDLELFRSLEASGLMSVLNSALPEDVRVIAARSIHWQTPSPSVSIEESIYRIGVPLDAAAGLPERIREFLGAKHVPETRQKGARTITIDLRPGVRDLILEKGELWLTLTKGSPIAVAARLLERSTEEVRQLPIRKTVVVLKEDVPDAADAD